MASQLCYNFHKKGNPVYQLYNRTLTRAIVLREYVNTYTDKIDELALDGDLYIISISDNAIEQISSQLSHLNLQAKAIIVHTSGNTSASILSNHINTGVFYPLQSVKINSPLDFDDVPLLITSEQTWIQEFLLNAGNIISQNSKIVTDEYRSKLHVPAVIVNNFTNYLYHIAYDYCQKENLDFSLLKPLIHETSDRIVSGKMPINVQTGPAIRGDKKTVNNHLKQLQNHPNMKLLYNYLSQRIYKDLTKGSK